MSNPEVEARIVELREGATPAHCGCVHLDDGSSFPLELNQAGAFAQLQKNDVVQFYIEENDDEPKKFWHVAVYRSIPCSRPGDTHLVRIIEFYLKGGYSISFK